MPNAINEREIIKDLENNLYPERLAHTMGVAKTAEKLAKHYGYDADKARIAGLLHDCAKNLKKSELYRICEDEKIELDFVSKNESKLVHAYVGAFFASSKYGIFDEDIYDAIFYHTIAKENMPILTKIIYLADTIEPNRKFDGEIEKMRDLAYKDLDAAIIMAMDGSIKYIMKKGGLIHPNTIIARNFLVHFQSGKD